MYDLALVGGLVVDGTRSKPRLATVCIQGGRIAEITDRPVLQVRNTVDVSGHVVAPGFIDIHTHSDASPLVDYPVESKLAQGVTTEIIGNCGISCLPATPEHLDEIEQYFSGQLDQPLYGKQVVHTSVSDYAQAVLEHGASLNYGALVGHGTLRLAVMGFDNRAPKPEEMEQLKSLLDRELSRGAFGMSLGLIYPPSAFSAREELVELAKVLKKHDAVLAVHMRSEGPKLFESLDEMLDITRRSGVHLEISHLKLMGKPQWGRSSELLKKITDAQSEGLNIHCDQYPFTATSTSLTALMPHWSHAGGQGAMIQRLKTREGTLCQDITCEMENRGGPDTIMITNTHGHRPEYEGLYVSQLAQQFGMSPVDTVIQILLECSTQASCVYFCINEEDMINIMKQMFISVGSDGYSLSYDPEYTKINPHPRNFSTFPQFFQLVREKSLMSLEDAVYKVSGLPASVLGIQDRGVIREGAVADLTIFDPQGITNHSTFINPKARPSGIPHVIVNGQFALYHGRLTEKREGTVLLRRQ